MNAKSWVALLLLTHTVSAKAVVLENTAPRWQGDVVIFHDDGAERFFFAAGDRYDARPCDGSMYKDCFLTSAFVFAIPVAIQLKAGVSWVVSSERFEVVSIRPTRKKNGCIYAIKTVQNHLNMFSERPAAAVVYYSPNSGIVGMDVIDASSSKLFKQYRTEARP